MSYEVEVRYSANVVLDGDSIRIRRGCLMVFRGAKLLQAWTKRSWVTVRLIEESTEKGIDLEV